MVVKSHIDTSSRYGSHFVPPCLSIAASKVAAGQILSSR